jgi:hypothetical protein
MKKIIPFLAVLAVVAIFIAGCSKGSAGPAGPAGPDNIAYSAWIPVSLTQNVDNNNDTTYTQSITVSALTSSILDNGAVLSYIGIPGSGTSGTDTSVFSISEASTYFGALTQVLSVGEIDLLSLVDYSGVLYRYVIIPGSMLTTSTFKQYTKAQLQKMDYSTITKLVNTAKAQSTTN